MLTRNEKILLLLFIIFYGLPIVGCIAAIAWEHFDDPEYPYSGFCPDTPQHFE